MVWRQACHVLHCCRCFLTYSMSVQCLRAVPSRPLNVGISTGGPECLSYCLVDVSWVTMRALIYSVKEAVGLDSSERNLVGCASITL